MRTYRYASPQSFEEYFDVLKKAGNEEVKLVAGGTDFVPRLSLELEQIPKEEKVPLNIVYLGKLGLDKITENGEWVVIGALCTLTDIKNDKTIIKEFPVLVSTINNMAGLTVRNTATIGGNIMNASPAADSVPSLIALDAAFVLKGEAGERTVLAKDFFKGPGKTDAKKDEVLTQIHIKKTQGKAAFEKIGRRKAETLSVANAAAYIEKDGNICTCARIAVGSVGATVIKCTLVEQELIGKELTEENIKAASQKALEMISPIDDIRSTAWYRKKVTPVIIARAVKAAADI